MCRRWLICGLLMFLFAGLAAGGCGKVTVNKKNHSDRNEVSETGEPSPCLSYFISTHPDNEVIKSAGADLDGDNVEDLVVIYRKSEEKNGMLVVLGRPGEYRFTNEVPAPVSNQAVTFKDIDDKPPLEFIVQGMKGANIGYAVYRVEGNRLEDLFGEGMKDCC
jgi:hypothetical protein